MPEHRLLDIASTAIEELYSQRPAALVAAVEALIADTERGEVRLADPTKARLRAAHVGRLLLRLGRPYGTVPALHLEAGEAATELQEQEHARTVMRALKSEVYKVLGVQLRYYSDRVVPLFVGLLSIFVMWLLMVLVPWPHVARPVTNIRHMKEVRDEARMCRTTHQAFYMGS